MVTTCDDGTGEGTDHSGDEHVAPQKWAARLAQLSFARSCDASQSSRSGIHAGCGPTVFHFAIDGDSAVMKRVALREDVSRDGAVVFKV